MLRSAKVTRDRLIQRIEPTAGRSFEDLEALCSDHAAQIRELLTSTGAVMFRGYDIQSAEQYEAVIARLGLDRARGPQMLNKLPDPQRTQNLPPPQPNAEVAMQGPHTELGWRSWRVRFVSLWC